VYLTYQYIHCEEQPLSRRVIAFVLFTICSIYEPQLYSSDWHIIYSMLFLVHCGHVRIWWWGSPI